jgi:hypothetical protein
MQYDPMSDSDSDDSDDDFPRSESSDDESEEELVDQEDGGSPQPRRRRKLNEDGQVSRDPTSCNLHGRVKADRFAILSHL